MHEQNPILLGTKVYMSSCASQLATVLCIAPRCQATLLPAPYHLRRICRPQRQSLATCLQSQMALLALQAHGGRRHWREWPSKGPCRGTCCQRPETVISCLHRAMTTISRRSCLGQLCDAHNSNLLYQTSPHLLQAYA